MAETQHMPSVSSQVISSVMSLFLSGSVQHLFAVAKHHLPSPPAGETLAGSSEGSRHWRGSCRGLPRHKLLS